MTPEQALSENKKVLILGYRRSGKTTLINKLTENKKYWSIAGRGKGHNSTDILVIDDWLGNGPLLEHVLKQPNPVIVAFFNDRFNKEDLPFPMRSIMPTLEGKQEFEDLFDLVVRL